MTLKECYAALGGDYDDAVRRLCSEKLVLKFVLRFIDDDSYSLLIHSLDEKNVEEAFRAAHTIKGVCQNLAFTSLEVSSSLMTEALRAGDMDGALGLRDELINDYEKTISAISALKNSEGTK